MVEIGPAVYMTMRAFLIGVIALLAMAVPALAADQAAFDLPGPSLRITVERGGRTLPIAEVPQLAAGDHLSIRADLPADQSARYLLVAAFLRGATNPPPKSWFFQSRTWLPQDAAGLALTVPASAQQVILFLAPATGGDFATLINAVRGRPGAFVRASQALTQASLDHQRLATFLEAVGKRVPSEPDRLKKITPLLARSLAVKINEECLEKLPDLQAACLMQNQDTLVLNDGYSNGVAETLTGPGSELVFQFAATPQAGFGYYSPYIGAVRDIIGVLNSIHRARYQYIPALAADTGDRVNLILNAAPSFHNPKSVLVASLPAVADLKPPTLHTVAADVPLCASGDELVLPVTGAPLAFATAYAHDMKLHVPASGSDPVDLAAEAVAEKGGFVVTTGPLAGKELKGPVDAVLYGSWGFDELRGPTFHLQVPTAGKWQVADADPVPIVGRTETITLTGGAAACVTGVALRPPSGKDQPVVWKAAAADTIKLTVPLGTFDAGKTDLLIAQDSVPDDIVAVAGAAGRTHVEGFELHAGDRFGALSGRHLDTVATLVLDGATFTPGPLSRTKDHDTLTMLADAAAATWTTGQSLSGRVRFADGRTRAIKTIVGPPRPVVTLLGKSLAVPPATTITIRLADADQLPHDARLTFSLRIGAGAQLLADDTVEVATATGGGAATLTTAGGLVMQDAHVAVATLDLAKSLGPSAFGPLQFRIVHEGVASDWQPLGTLVRLPRLQHLRCPAAPAPCSLSGSELFLIAAVSVTPRFDIPVNVPDGYPSDVLTVPRPVEGRLFLKLRDNPAAIAQIVG